MEAINENKKALAVLEKINSANLKKNQYTVSLLNEAYRVGVLTRDDVNNIQLQLMLIVKELIIRYTKGESTSVSVYTAESILNSVIYCIDACTLSCESPEEAIRSLLTIQLRKLYEKGLKKVSMWFEEAIETYKKVKRNKLKVGLESYDHTINEDVPLFFRKYGAVFDSHNMAASIDYHLAFDDMSVQGVLYMKNYLDYLFIENVFCRYFDEEEIERLLCEFGRTFRMDYKIELINIFELVFNNAVFAVLAGSTENNLGISKYHFDMLNNRLKALKDSEISESIDKALKKLIETMSIIETEILEYIFRYREVFIQRVISAAHNDSLDSIIIADKEERNKGYTVLFENGSQMNSSDFILFIKKLLKLPRPQDKINLIKLEINSLHDFIDILNSDCLYGDEFEALFSTLGDMELAVLSKIVFYEDLRNDFASLKFVVSTAKERESEWQVRFAEFLKNTGSKRIESIDGLLGEIDYEEISFY